MHVRRCDVHCFLEDAPFALYMPPSPPPSLYRLLNFVTPLSVPLSTTNYNMCTHDSAVQGSPVKKRGVGRWRLSGAGCDGAGGGGLAKSPLRSNRNPFSPQVSGSTERLSSGAAGQVRRDC